MGNVEKGKRAHLSGKIGNMVFFSRNGKQLFRKHVVPHNPQTPAQSAHRAKFALASRVLKPLFAAIKQGHGQTSLHYGSLCGRVMREVITGESPNLRVNYSRLTIAEGALTPPHNVSFHFDSLTRQVRITWDSTLPSEEDVGSPTDQVTIVCFHEAASPAVRTHLAGKRFTGESRFQLPEGWDLTGLHCWIYFTSYNGVQHSQSIYVDR
jgi:hypothetical protein